MAWLWTISTRARRLELVARAWAYAARNSRLLAAGSLATAAAEQAAQQLARRWSPAIAARGGSGEFARRCRACLPQALANAGSDRPESLPRSACSPSWLVTSRQRIASGRRSMALHPRWPAASTNRSRPASPSLPVWRPNASPLTSAGTARPAAFEWFLGAGLGLPTATSVQAHAWRLVRIGSMPTRGRVTLSYLLAVACLATARARPAGQQHRLVAPTSKGIHVG